MKEEIDAAVNFILKLIKQNSNLNHDQLKKFEHCLKNLLTQKFNNHWHPERPWQGQGYRCLRVNGINGKEPTIAKAAFESGLKYSDLKLPLELTVWVDPEEVCCRFGEHKGSYCTVASFHEGSREDFTDKIDLAQIIHLDKRSDSVDSSTIDSQAKPKYPISPKKYSMSKENIAPTPYFPTIHSKTMISESNVKSVFSPSHIPRRVSGRLSNRNSPLLYNQQQHPIHSVFHNSSNGMHMFSQNESLSPYYKTAPSWINCRPITSQHPLYTSNVYVDVSSPHFSSQDNINFNRNSPPINVNKLRWNSGPLLNGNSYTRNDRQGWFAHCQLTRV